MDHTEPLPQPDPAFIRRQRDLYYQVVHNLFRMLPGPRGETHAQYDRRIRVAIDRVATLAPVNADEAAIATHCVAADAHADDCLGAAVDSVSQPPVMLQLRKQAASMLRASSGQHSLLLRVQAARHKREANDTTHQQDAWSEHAALGWMTQALEEQYAPAQAAKPAPSPEPVPTPPPSPAPVAAHKPQQQVAANKPTHNTQTPNKRTHGAVPAATHAAQHDIDPRDADMLRMLERLAEDRFDRHGAAFLESAATGAMLRPGAGTGA